MSTQESDESSRERRQRRGQARKQGKKKEKKKETKKKKKKKKGAKHGKSDENLEWRREEAGRIKVVGGDGRAGAVVAEVGFESASSWTERTSSTSDDSGRSGSKGRRQVRKGAASNGSPRPVRAIFMSGEDMSGGQGAPGGQCTWGKEGKGGGGFLA